MSGHGHQTKGPRYVLWGGLVVALFFGSVVYHYEMVAHPMPESVQQISGPMLSIDNTAIHLLLATTTAEQQQGLSGTAGLPADTGMLFVFPQSGQYAFWMKDMQYSLDIIWMDQTGTVVYVAPDLSPASYPHSFVSSAPARYVLEVPAGFAAQYGIKVGDRAVISL